MLGALPLVVLPHQLLSPDVQRRSAALALGLGAHWALGLCGEPVALVERAWRGQHPVMLYVAVPLLALGLMMTTRGWIYTLRPDGKIAQKRKRRNLKLGFTTDMKLFGRKVRRLGLLITLIGGGIIAWTVSERADENAALTETPTAGNVQGAPR